ncbi:MAG: hypothetical protein H6837_01435 [Planctomycetes bacterium]|nr:hypothetical protein [Planctomycetota bacterium]
MNDLTRRVLGYGAGALVVGGLVYAGFLHRGQADAATLLGSVEVHLRLAASMPEKTTDGGVNAVRRKLLGQAREFLEAARLDDPELFLGFEFAGWLSALDGDFKTAAAMYRRAQSGKGATPQSAEADLLNEVRMLRAAALPEQALQVLAKRLVSPENAAASRIETMLAHAQAGRADAAAAVASEVIETVKKPMPLIEAAALLESQGKLAAATAGYQRAAASDAVANYFVARLKMRAGELDTSFDLLKRAVVADGQKVRALLDRERDAWKPVRDDSRFKSIVAPVGAPAQPGR